MNWLQAMIVIGWCYLIGDAWFQGASIPNEFRHLDLPDIPVWMMTAATISALCVSFFSLFLGRKKLMEDMPYITNLIDLRFGLGSYHRFNQGLRPFLFSMLACLVFGVSCLLATHESTRDPLAYGLGCVMLAAGIGMIIALLLSRKYPPIVC